MSHLYETPKWIWSSNGSILDLRDVHKYCKTAIGDYHALNAEERNVFTCFS